MKKHKIKGYIIPIRDGGYKWRVKQNTGNLIHDCYESMMEFSSASGAAISLAKHLEQWEPINKKKMEAMCIRQS